MEGYKIEALIRMYSGYVIKFRDLMLLENDPVTREGYAARKNAYFFVVQDLKELLEEGEEI